MDESWLRLCTKAKNNEMEDLWVDFKPFETNHRGRLIQVMPSGLDSETEVHNCGRITNDKCTNQVQTIEVCEASKRAICAVGEG